MGLIEVLEGWSVFWKPCLRRTKWEVVKGVRVRRERVRRWSSHKSGSHKRQLGRVPTGSPSYEGEARMCFP